MQNQLPCTYRDIEDIVAALRTPSNPVVSSLQVVEVIRQRWGYEDPDSLQYVYDAGLNGLLTLWEG